MNVVCIIQVGTYRVNVLELNISSLDFGQHGCHWVLTHLCQRITNLNTLSVLCGEHTTDLQVVLAESV